MTETELALCSVDATETFVPIREALVAYRAAISVLESSVNCVLEVSVAVVR